MTPTDDVLLTAETHLSEPATAADSDAAVAALSRALDRWSEEIATALLRLRTSAAALP